MSVSSGEICTPPCFMIATIERNRCWLVPMRPVTPLRMMPMRRVCIVAPRVDEPQKVNEPQRHGDTEDWRLMREALLSGNNHHSSLVSRFNLPQVWLKSLRQPTELFARSDIYMMVGSRRKSRGVVPVWSRNQRLKVATELKPTAS